MCEHRVIKGLGCAADGSIFCHRFEEEKKSWLMMVDSFFCWLVDLSFVYWGYLGIFLIHEPRLSIFYINRPFCGTAPMGL
jgi:hypothetical protein